MAFLKPIEIRNTGLVATYWRLTQCQTDHRSGIVEFHLHGYPDQEARAQDKQPLPVIAFRLSPEEAGVVSLHDLTTAALYAAARLHPATDGTVWFADATDC